MPTAVYGRSECSSRERTVHIPYLMGILRQWLGLGNRLYNNIMYDSPADDTGQVPIDLFHIVPKGFRLCRHGHGLLFRPLLLALSPLSCIFSLPLVRCHLLRSFALLPHLHETFARFS